MQHCCRHLIEGIHRRGRENRLAMVVCVVFLSILSSLTGSGRASAGAASGAEWASTVPGGREVFQMPRITVEKGDEATATTTVGAALPEEKPAEKPVKRPAISGWHSWKYNQFSSYDQLRINLEQEGAKGQKSLISINGLYYQEEDNKSWSSYLGESYYKFRAGNFDFKTGLLVDTLGSGDKVSFIDKINSRRFHNGLANEYNRDKKEVPAIKTTYYINKRMSWDLHYMPVFQASELPNIYGRWATAFQKEVARMTLLGTPMMRENDTRVREQYHLGFNSAFKKYEIRYHYLWLKERLPVIDLTPRGSLRWEYPIDETFAVDGNITLGKDFLMRYEMAWSPTKTFASYQDGRVGPRFQSNLFGMLLGTDKTYRNNLYLNVQGIVSYISNMRTKTPYQLKPLEFMTSLQLKKGFRSETFFIEFNSVGNLTTGEYVLSPQMSLQRGDFLKFVGGVHVNGKSTDALGPVGQFDENNTPFLETQIIF